MSKAKLKLLLFYSSTLILYVPQVSAATPAPPARITGLETVFSRVLASLLTLVATASLIMLIIGGFQFLSAGANKESAARAQSTITYSVLGLMVSLSAWIILSLAGKFLGVNFTNFSICIISGC
ncbi:MAG: hypothetical protein UX91_C0001G0120 [Candidatus Amesbacteria bacterium GW2011_GWB1_47_19]|nr:MAG: hypothetical protein UW51_C0001G0120 [Candidatus Amesbacteria bacterium GW2011_GWA1_44_24]KKU32132.1 MAG: hypothetical protein UX46_C0001G0119 [Candidatus Amesbacteria bacterium GW2011_GWC1_46_24]KKU67816.1 MAG: hypothetical protein UX91_C0001G0120 [Candidatus Amesbacteria bacterium GW2011_GWB1_47_19]OGD05021.1 MAG: hypothetical protein A2379_03915 [Candidatus Amesbacteria bacterium RIFOXYB1_FULL_47_13]HBC72416.1 hypothetical protein [Candidatus Amesbacteria bacterium]